jgi:TUP1-like enhancer of split
MGGRVQFQQATGSGSPLSASFKSPTTPGNLLVAVATSSASAINTPTSWLSAIAVPANSTGDFIQMFYFPNAPSTSNVSMTLVGTKSVWNLFIAEYFCPLSDPDPLDQTNSDVNTTTSTSGTITTTSAKSVTIVGFSNNQGFGYSDPSNSFTLVGQQQNNVTSGSAYLDFFSTSTGTYSTTCFSPIGSTGIIADFGGVISFNTCKLECRLTVRSW